ncbi:hypothetical protein FJZ31_15790 [Candidatus Poribacteria bacterium]|nr:hypothetical protein [Candidatus Poribacteria bacterium]
MSRLHKFIVEIISTAKDVCPEAEVSFTTESLEGEDATIKIVVPAEKFDEVDEAVSEKRYQVFLDEGYDIVLSVSEKEQAVAAAAG